MKKKTKILGTLSATILSISMLGFGVYAASSVNLSVSSTVKFNATSVYLKVNGEVKTGDDSSLATATGGGDYKYIGYSYDAKDEELESDTQISDYNDEPTGLPSNEIMQPWNIGNISFDENNYIIQYAFTFTNYSEFNIEVTVTPNDLDGQEGVSEDYGENIFVIEPRSSASFNYNLKLTNFSKSFNLNVGFNISAIEKSTYAPVKNGEGSFPDQAGFTLTVNDVVYDESIFNEKGLQEGDHVQMNLSGGTGRIILYNKEDEIVQQWGNIPLPSTGSGDNNLSYDINDGNSNGEYEYIEPDFIVPSFEEGSYFVVMVGSSGGQHSGGAGA